MQITERNSWKKHWLTHNYPHHHTSPNMICTPYYCTKTQHNHHNFPFHPIYLDSQNGYHRPKFSECIAWFPCIESEWPVNTQPICIDRYAHRMHQCNAQCHHKCPTYQCTDHRHIENHHRNLFDQLYISLMLGLSRKHWWLICTEGFLKITIFHWKVLSMQNNKTKYYQEDTRIECDSIWTYTSFHLHSISFRFRKHKHIPLVLLKVVQDKSYYDSHWFLFVSSCRILWCRSRFLSQNPTSQWAWNRLI